MRSAPTVSGSSTCSTIGSPARASMTRGVTPSQPSHASTSGAVTAGTTDPIAAPVMVARSRSPARSSSWSSSPSSSGVRSTAVVRRQCARSASPSNTPTVVSVLPMSKTRITNPPRERESHCEPKMSPPLVRTSNAPRASMPSTMPATGALHRFPRAQSRRSNSWSSGALNAPGSAAAARTAGTSSASTSMRSTPARRARACGTPSGTRQLIPIPIATQSTRSSRQRLSIRMPPSFPSSSTRSFGHFTRTSPSVNASSARAAASPVRSESTSSAASSRGRAMSVIQIPAPDPDAHARPPRPRPAVCRSARMSVPSGAPSRASGCAMSSVDATSSKSSARGTPHRATIVAASAPA